MQDFAIQDFAIQDFPIQGFIELCLFVVAYWAASKAVQGWGELAVLIAVITVVIWPVKLIGAYVSPAFAENAVIITTDPKWSLSVHPTVAFPVAVIIAAVLMLAAEEVYMRVRKDGVEREGN